MAPPRRLLDLVPSLRDLSVEEWARAAGTDRYRLHDACDAAWGVPPRRILRAYKDAVADELAARGTPVSVIAATLGYSDPSTYRRFRRRSGREP